MQIKIKEQVTKLNLPEPVKKLIKNKYRRRVFLLVIVIATILIAFLAMISTDIGDILKSKSSEGKDYSMVLQHYSGFDFSDTHVAVRLDWTDAEVRLKDNRAEKKLNARVYPVNIKDMNITYYSDDEEVAEVDGDGNIIAKKPGAAKIKVVADNGTYHAENEAMLTVIQPVDGIYMPNTTITLYMGSTGQLLEYKMSPSDATNQNVTWKSKDEKIATVDSNGHVRPVGLGMTEIIATTEEGEFQAKCFVTVVNYAVSVNSVLIENEYKNDAYLKAGETLNVVAAVSPSNARNKTLKWESSDNNIATVSQTGRVRAISEGKAQIKVTSVNGKSDVLNLTVQPGDTNNALNLYTENNTVTNGAVTYTTYNISLSDIVDIQMGLDPPPKYNGGKQLASRDQTMERMNPSNYSTGAYKYQFLDLSYSNGISEEALNSFLSDKGILRGHGEDFIRAAKAYNISEVYLVAHACLETGNGTSTLSTGVNVNGVTVYNMYGIGAYDNSAVASGSQRAYELGWTSVSEAIIGGAQWISNNYINSTDGRQNTLYKMLWNPEHPGQHQYATDIEWATQQAVNIEKIFRMFPEAVKVYDVPVYEGMAPPIIDTDN